MKKILYFILPVILAVSALSFTSCGDEGDAGREAFSPESAAYKIMLPPEDWMEISVSFDPAPDQLGIFHTPSGIILIIDSYRKATLADIGVSELNSFIDFYKSLERIKSMYEDNIRTGNLTDIDKNDIKKSSVTAGKRQSFYLQGSIGEYINELIHLETDDYFLAISYSSPTEKLSDNQQIVTDVIAHISTEK